MTFLIGAIKIIFLIGFLVFIHEGGHFLAAKACKIYVKEFSIGFGPKLISWQGKETKYSIRLIPLGGYVSMLGEDERSDEEGSFSKASILQRMFIVLAGPAINLIFGFIVYFILVSTSGNNISTTISKFDEQYNVTAEQLQVGDTILSLNGKKVHNKAQLDEIMSKSSGDSITVKVKRGDEVLEKTFKPNVIETKILGVYFSTSSSTPKIKYIVEDSNANSSGIEVGDIITKVNDVEINDYMEIPNIVNAEGVEKVNVEVRRRTETLNFEIEPKIDKRYVLGVYLEMAENSFSNNIYYGWWDTLYFSKNFVDNIKNIFTHGINPNQVAGPIGISEMVVETNGVYDFVYLLCTISLSLGATNLFPVPALDGGRFVLLLIEAIRRKPLDEEVELQIQMIGFTILILFSLYVSYKDILRIF